MPEPGRPGHQDQAPRPLDQLFDDRRQAELLEGEKLVGNSPQHQPHVAALLEDGDPEPGHIAEREPEVGPPHFLKLLLAPLRRDALHERHGVGRLEHLGRQRTHVTMKPQHRLTTDGQVQVARLLRANGLKQFVDEQRTHCPDKPPRKRRWNPSRLPRTLTRGLTFSYKPGVHRFVMSGLEVRTRVSLPHDNIIISVETHRSSKHDHLVADCQTHVCRTLHEPRVDPAQDAHAASRHWRRRTRLARGPAADPALTPFFGAERLGQHLALGDAQDLVNRRDARGSP